MSVASAFECTVAQREDRECICVWLAGCLLRLLAPPPRRHWGEIMDIGWRLCCTRFTDPAPFEMVVFYRSIGAFMTGWILSTGDSMELFLAVMSGEGEENHFFSKFCVLLKYSTGTLISNSLLFIVLLLLCNPPCNPALLFARRER